MVLADPKPVKSLPQANATGSKRRKKKTRKEKQEEEEARRQRLLQQFNDSKPDQQLPSGVTVEYVEQSGPDVSDTEFSDYSAVFANFESNAVKSFGIDEEADGDIEEDIAPGTLQSDTIRRGGDTTVETRPDDDMSSNNSDAESMASGSDEGNNNRNTGMSRKQKKRIRMSVAELKQIAPRPEVVEWTDTSAHDPELLVSLKAAPNTVPVPIHWSQKKKYLQYKRGMEKPPFELPDFIKATGIMEMRDAAKEKEDEKQSKSVGRERMRPKMNKLTLDYQRLHDAFFRFQEPPKNMTGHGDLFYEGRESDVTYSYTPGILSDALKNALNIPPLAPPPWLINMQRFGPPPSYSTMDIPGLNKPIPSGAQWGYHPGGWGRPPVDEFGRPLYGDVFAAGADGAQTQQIPSTQDTEPKKYWGDFEVFESSDEEDEDEIAEESEPEEEPVSSVSKEADVHAADRAELAELTDEQIRSGLASIPSGLETPSAIQLRKHAADVTTEANRSLYTVLPEKETAQLEGIMGSQFTYDMGKALDPSKKKSNAGGKKSRNSTDTGVDIALDASELEGLDQDALKEKYEAAAEAQVVNQTGGQEDLSDMVAEHAATQVRKRKPPAASSTAPKKKAKDFKF
ncbi:hypothetical protein H4R24_002085 [Coemansia sp. RSA 988]|nr:hypothetical protein H4R24_002085 [Coemansia sp. RSA 988]